MIHLKTKFLDCDCELATDRRHLNGSPMLRLIDDKGQHLITLSCGHLVKVDRPYESIEYQRVPAGIFTLRPDSDFFETTGVTQALVDMGLIEQVPNIPYSSTKLKMYKILTKESP